MSIKIVKPGLFSTIQDLGRFGYQDQGFSTAGALDPLHFQLGQALIHNEGPAIECAMIGPTIEFLEPNTFVITGAHFKATLNDQPVANQSVIMADKGDVLALNQAVEGVRAYIHFGNPIDVPCVAGSYSTHTRSGIGGFHGRVLKANDIIQMSDHEGYHKYAGLGSDVSLLPEDTSRFHIIEGPQFDAFSDEAKATIVNNDFTVSDQADRMGYRLQGVNLAPKNSSDIISEPVALGSIQVPNDGNPIVLLNDKQTVGGYTKIATVCKADLPFLAQKKPGDTINFEWISTEEATKRYNEKIQAFKQQLDQIDSAPLFTLSQLRTTSQRLQKLLRGE
ncbi:biotin-dependent carboxyltransferase family protein [Staphylococcus auricularis]|uniref:Allophanate hydrolase n=1 Tax=Staphylococcus auricularis TaxID=29379 RepID=A0AAP8PN04_9STAP|nr:biotin-dependent carboxyltransferase family protein [Staphylococcus auricularis]PNZ66087.1 allophanate hydrolase [Staphylococcus auricularis]QPT05174.1 biotin-dependent carboxyltransferase family protein [Staphylococcus auricularis]BCU52470.1 biotin-dependent carboxyltransferase family protein [Staphylococcus auricularis]SQJ12066.1 allophanate hydrolase subunit 2 [Staphylococcus auricularis]